MQAAPVQEESGFKRAGFQRNPVIPCKALCQCKPKVFCSRSCRERTCRHMEGLTAGCMAGLGQQRA